MSTEERNILYELLVHAEWQLEPEIIGEGVHSRRGSILYRTLTQTPSSIGLLLSYFISLVKPNSAVSPTLTKIISEGSEWKLAVGDQGLVIAILQETALEIRAKKDEYASVVGKTINLYADPFPSWRKIAWSSDCSMVAVGYSNGVVEIFSTLADSLFTIYPPRFVEYVPQVDTYQSLAALFFTDIRIQSKKWVSELIMIDYYGKLYSYYVSPTEGYQEGHRSEFTKLYTGGISAAVNTGSLLLVAGPCSYTEDIRLRNNGLGHGISLWRLLSDYPYYKEVPTVDEEYIPFSVPLLRKLWRGQQTRSYDTIFNLCVSPNGRHVAALHASGSLSIWDVPSLRKRKFWPLDLQPDVENARGQYMPMFHNPQTMSMQRQLCNHPVDVKWWSDTAIILARFSGAVTVCSVNSLVNLLGESPEFFEGVPQVGEAHDLSFLGLEMERRLVKSMPRSSELVNNGYSGQHYADSDDDEDASVIVRSRRLIKRALFWITDAERFRPPCKKPKFVSQTSRLLSLRSTTPEELFSRKIENEEYGEALTLAQQYGLDCDQVYLQQWRKHPASLHTISDYLAKIRKRSLVLEECLNRVPTDIDAARELLLYGLRGTELDTLVAVGAGTDEEEFVLTDLCTDYDDTCQDDEDAEATALLDLQKRKQLLSQVDPAKLSAEQKDVIRARRKLLIYLDRLAVYEILLGGSEVAAELFDPDFYATFRNQSPLEACINFAHGGDCHGVEVLFTYHGNETLDHRLALLSNFPSTLGPYEYRNLLPECDLHGELYSWEEYELRTCDWSEDAVFQYVEDGSRSDVADVLYENHLYLHTFHKAQLSATVVSEWYQVRAKEIEQSSHFVDTALDLLKLGRERNIPNLQKLHDTLDTLEVLVYEVGVTDLTLEKFLALSHAEKVQLLLSTSSSETIIQNIRNWVLPFLAHCERHEPGCSASLLREYVVSAAKRSLAVPLKVLQLSQNTGSPDSIFKTKEDILKVGLDSIYACENPSEILLAFAILECLPSRDISDDPVIVKLQKEVVAVEELLTACELLSTYSLSVTCTELKVIKEDKGKVVTLLTRLAHTCIQRTAIRNTSEWKKMFSDMLSLQQKIFSVIDPQVCFEVAAESLLTSGKPELIAFTREYLEVNAESLPVHGPYLQRVPFVKSVDLVVKAASQYCNSSESDEDEAIDLALQCLDIIETEDENIRRETDLISAIKILPRFGIKKLPLQVRLCEDPLLLIKEALEYHPKNYTYGNRFLLLAQLLRVAGGERKAQQAKMFVLLAQAAFKVSDFENASGWCDRLVTLGHEEGWLICSKLGRCEEFDSLNLRAKYLNFALTRAPVDHLESLLTARNEVELLILYSRVQNQINHSDNSSESDEAFEDAVDEEGDHWGDPEGEMSQPRFHHQFFLKFPIGLMSATATKVTSVANRKLWKDALGWIRPLKDMMLRGSEEVEVSDNVQFSHQGCHAFYSDVCPGCHISNIGMSYTSCSPVMENPALDFSLTLLCTALLEETLFLGNMKPLNRTVVQEVVKGFLPEDLALGLCFLSLVNDPEEVVEILESFPKNETTLQILVYYFGLQIFTSRQQWKGPRIVPVYLHDPKDVAHYVSEALKSSCTTEDEKRTAALISHFQKAQGLLHDYVQGQALQNLGAGVNVSRFLQDSSYKEDTVLGLAMTKDNDVLNLAVSLAEKYNVSLWHVYMTHLQYLFDTDMSVKDIGNQIEKLDLIRVLQTEPEKFLRAMKTLVYLTINGSDHERLKLYFSVIEKVLPGNTSDLQSSLHIELLDQLSQTAPNLNYKALLDPTTDVSEFLSDSLTKDNIDQLADLMEKTAAVSGSSRHASSVHCVWAQKYFFDNTEDRKQSTASNFIQRYNALQDTLSHLTPHDFETLIKNLTLSEKSCSHVPLEARQEIIRRACQFCKGRCAVSEMYELWEETSDHLEALGSHLELLQSETFESFLHSSDPAVRLYAQQFAMSGGLESSLQELARQVLLAKSSLDMLRTLLSIYPAHASTTLSAEDVLMEAIQTLMMKWKNDSLEITEEHDMFEILDHLLHELNLYFGSGGELLQEEQVLDEIRILSQDSAISLNTRIKILDITQKYFSMDEVDIQLLNLMKTKATIGNMWPAYSSCRDVTLESVGEEEFRLSLFKDLICDTTSAIQCQALLTLLDVWPPFSAELCENAEFCPWLSTLLKFTEHADEMSSSEILSTVWEATVNIATKNEISEQSLTKLIACLYARCGSNALKTVMKLSFLNTARELQIKTLNLYNELEGEVECNMYDKCLLEQIVRNKMVAEVVPSPLYKALFAFLSECNEDLYQSALNQMVSKGYLLEAAGLSASRSSLPRNLLSLSSFAPLLKKILK